MRYGMFSMSAAAETLVITSLSVRNNSTVIPSQICACDVTAIHTAVVLLSYVRF